MGTRKLRQRQRLPKVFYQAFDEQGWETQSADSVVSPSPNTISESLRLSCSLVAITETQWVGTGMAGETVATTVVGSRGLALARRVLGAQSL